MSGAPMSVRSSQADSARDSLQVEGGVAEIEAGRVDALVQVVQRMLLAVPDGAEDLMAAAGDREARLTGVRLRQRDLGVGREPLGNTPGGVVEQPTGGVDVAD